MEEQETKKASRFQSFIFVIVIPLLFAVTAALIIMTILGYNVFETAKDVSQKLPFVSSAASDKEDSSVQAFEEKMIKLEAEIKDREAKITNLEAQLDTKDEEISAKQLEIEQLEKEIEELNKMKEENNRAFKDIVKTYETISAKKAAPILAQMEDKEALRILSVIKADALASILEKMNPEDAARYTELLTDDSEIQ